MLAHTLCTSWYPVYVYTYIDIGVYYIQCKCNYTVYDKHMLTLWVLHFGRSPLPDILCRTRCVKWPKPLPASPAYRVMSVRSCEKNLAPVVHNSWDACTVMWTLWRYLPQHAINKSFSQKEVHCKYANHISVKRKYVHCKYASQRSYEAHADCKTHLCQEKHLHSGKHQTNTPPTPAQV